MSSVDRKRITPGQKPSWLKVPLPQGQTTARLARTLRERGLHTVCEEARCPNMGECWDGGTATFMVLGDTCTRGCRFCAVKTHAQGNPVDPDEPAKVADAAAAMGLRYVVLTMVDRDDLADGGAGHVAATIRALKQQNPELLVEALVGDMNGGGGPDAQRERIATILAAGPDVYAHNVETVLRLTPRVRDQRCSYVGSLATLRTAKQLRPDVVTKSSLMLGLGESEREVEQAMDDLREHAVDVVTFGQYLRPTIRHLPVKEHVTPARFKALEHRAQGKGFLYVASGPLVRSSYKAAEYYIAGMLRQRRALAAAATATQNPSPETA
ncbi:MAG: lipoyl synthase [Planctomycetes bacterium]|nr:lipoyl synthase [Planctomycetota bacterium]